MRDSIYETTTLSLILTAAVLALNGCAINPEANKLSAIGETTCSLSTKTFDPSSDAQPSLILTQLPPGNYTHANAEVYFENTVPLADGTRSTSKVQFLETPVAGSNPPSFATSVRCRETVAAFRSYTSLAPLITDFTVFNSGNFDTTTRSYSLAFNIETSPTLTIGSAGDLRSATAETILNTLSAYWNGGSRFARRSGNIFEFFGTRIVSGQTVFGKAVYTRSDLPPNSL